MRGCQALLFMKEICRKLGFSQSSTFNHAFPRPCSSFMSAINYGGLIWNICQTLGQGDVIIDRVAPMGIAGQLVMYHRIHSAVLEAYQSTIGQRILSSNICLHLNPNLKESWLHIYNTYIHEQ